MELDGPRKKLGASRSGLENLIEKLHWPRKKLGASRSELGLSRNFVKRLTKKLGASRKKLGPWTSDLDSCTKRLENFISAPGLPGKKLRCWGSGGDRSHEERSCILEMSLRRAAIMMIDAEYLLSARLPVSQKQITEFCQRWKISEFALFGSVLRADFRTDSDIDILVTFAPDSNWSLFDWIEIKDDLKALFKRDVDIADKEGLHNPYRRQTILNTYQIIYASE